MSDLIGVIAALPREVAGLVRGLEPEKALLGRGVFLYRVDRAVVVAAGMGAGRAAVAVEAARSVGGCNMLISCGLAGGCEPGVKVGSVLEAGLVVDEKTGERFATEMEGVTLVTAAGIASVAEKARLRVAYGASLVDMEAATVGRLARAHGLKFRAIKGISDGFEFELEGLGRFAGRHGSFRTGAFALHTALRPWKWGKAMELGRGSGAALKKLEEVLRAAIA